LDNFHYSDNKYIVTIPEFIGCTIHGDTYEEAVKNGQEAIEVCIKAEEALGRSLPHSHDRCSVTGSVEMLAFPERPVLPNPDCLEDAVKRSGDPSHILMIDAA